MNLAEHRDSAIYPQNESYFGESFVAVSATATYKFESTKEMPRGANRRIKEVEKGLIASRDLDPREELAGVLYEARTDASWATVVRRIELGDQVVELSADQREIVEKCLVEVRTKYKPVAKKVRPAVTQLPENLRELLDRVASEPPLRPASGIGHKFTPETVELLDVGSDGLLTPVERHAFIAMLSDHGKAFSFTIDEIGCVDPTKVTPMVIFTVPHIPWDLKPIPVPRALAPQLAELLKEKLKARILERSDAPYSNRWFTVKKKNGKLRFIQDMQPVNKVTIRNSGVGPLVEEFAEEFAGRSIYSMGDLYSGYDQFQLAEGSRDITSLRTPLGLLRMSTLPMGATNSVAHMQNAMSKIMEPFVPDKARPFIDDIPIKGCPAAAKNESLNADGLRMFVADHIGVVRDVLRRLIEFGVTLSVEKSSFGRAEVQILGQMCGPYGRRPCFDKVDAIQRLGECRTSSEVRRFLGACVFYVAWIPHFSHTAEPLYRLQKKSAKWIWGPEQSQAMAKLKQALTEPPLLRPPVYDGRAIVITIDASPIAAGWALGQDDDDGTRFAIRFGAKIFGERQQRYAQVKRELWAARCALHRERNYLIGAEVILETDCLSLLGMIANCTVPDVAMLRWIAFIRMFNPELQHIRGRDNPVADMLSRARYVSDPEGGRILKLEVAAGRGDEISGPPVSFREDLYRGQLKQIGVYLDGLEREPGLTNAQFRQLRKLSYKYILREGYLWRRPKSAGSIPLRVVGTDQEKLEILKSVHDEAMGGHRAAKGTYENIRRLYWWPGLYVDVRRYCETCAECQYFSKVRHRDELVPTYPLDLHFEWGLDIVYLPRDSNGASMLVVARENLSNYVEARPLFDNSTKGVCVFILEEIIARHGMFTRMRADNNELSTAEARAFFEQYRIKLKLTSTYNPEGNGKIERGHVPIVQALAKSCDGDFARWSEVLPLTLLADRMTWVSTTGYAPAELMLGHLPKMPWEENIVSWRTIPWEDGISREQLVGKRVRHFQLSADRIERTRLRLKAVRSQNRILYNRRHRIRPVPISEGDWVLVFDNKAQEGRRSERKLSKRWRGPYVVVTKFPNATYLLRELDGTVQAMRHAGKNIKLFKRRKGDGMESATDTSSDEDAES